MTTRPHSAGSSHPAPVPDADPAMQRVRGLAHLLDNSIRLPGGFRIGLDALIGLVPGFGDWAGALLSGYILTEAARLGASRSLLLRMAANVGIETLVGAVPLLGDLFDAGWKANARNVRLLDRHLGSPEPTRRASRGFLLLLLLGLALLLVGAMAVALLLLRALAGLF